MEFEKFISEKALVVAYVGDVDACASYAALSRLARKLNPKSELAFTTFGAMNKEGLKVLKKFGEDVVGYSPQLVMAYSKIMLIDTPETQMPNELKGKDVLVIDHHTKDKEGKKAVSTTELVYELFKKYKIKIDRESALAIIYGLLADTAGLRFANTKAISILGELLAENNLEYQEVTSDIIEEKEISERLACIKAAKRLELKQVAGKLVAVSHVGSFESSAAGKLLGLGADVVLVVSRKPKECRIIGRARAPLDISKMFSKLAQELGGTGGGHPGASVMNVPLSKEKEALSRVLRELG
jgi:nanoRNase/pAp phosphatase (c-di-AMP/oligoRNAs hydrolase)